MRTVYVFEPVCGPDMEVEWNDDEKTVDCWLSRGTEEEVFFSLDHEEAERFAGHVQDLVNKGLTKPKDKCK